MDLSVPICASLGAMGPLLWKLDWLVASGSILPEEVQNSVDLLIQGIKKMNTFLVNLSEAEDPPLTAKLWMNEARDLSYDMEDYFDRVVRSGAGAGADARAGLSGNSARVKISRLLKAKLKRRSPTAAKILEFKQHVQEACERHQRYGLDSLTLKRRFFSYGPRLPIGHAELIDHGPAKDLMNWLGTDGDKQEQLKVASIVGYGGVGKTTLAKMLYQKKRGRFQCRAFARVTPYPDMRRLLSSIYFQIQKQQPRAYWDANDLINNIAECLQNKSYFIIIDDLWSTSVWDIISPSFPEGTCCSRVITTTQIEEVAFACCSYHSENIFKMTPLSDKHARELFFNRVFGCEDDCPREFKEISDAIITKCGDLPLLTVNIANMLAFEPVLLMEHWIHIEGSLCSTSWINSSNLRVQKEEELITDPTAEEIKKVLNLSYNNLPPHLKTCLLYFNMFPEDCTIEKDDLVKQWVAEGFLDAIRGHHREEVAGDYFDELVSRGMIQPVDTNYNNEVLSCTVHHMVLDLIAYKCMENNFITIVDYFQTSLGFQDMVRRLSVQFGGAKSANIPAGIRMTQVRSLIFFGFWKCVPSIVDCRFLRVLVLHIWADEDNKSFDLTRINEILLLSYLKIACNVTVKLPAQMEGLKLLETLEVGATGVEDVPSDIVCLQRLSHLLLPSEIVMPEGFGQMISLRTLGHFDLSNNLGDNFLSLGQLTNLQDLHLTCSTVTSNYLVGNVGRLASILGKTSNLRSLVMDGGASSSMSIRCDCLSTVSPHPALLEKFQLSTQICIISLPRWIRELSKLCILKIALQKLSSDDVDILKGLPALADLSLYVRIAPAERIVFNKEGFLLLKHFKFICVAPCVAFMEGSMPNVRRLELGFSANTEEQYSLVAAGLEHLIGLEVFCAKIRGGGADESVIMAARCALREAFSRHPDTLIINIQVELTFDGDKENSTVTQDTDPYEQTVSRNILPSKSDTKIQNQDSSMQNPDCTQQHNMPYDALVIVEINIRAAVKIDDAAETVQQNENECLDIDDCATEIRDILSSNKEAVQRMAISGSLENLTKSLDEALTFVEKCNRSHFFRRELGAGEVAKNLRRAKEDLWQKLIVDIALSIVEKIVSAAAKVSQAVQNVHQNKEDCHNIDRCCAQVSAIVSRIMETTSEWLQHPTTRRILEDLAERVQKALELVTVCQQPSHIICRLWRAEQMANKLRRVEEEIRQNLSLLTLAATVEFNKMSDGFLQAFGTSRPPLPAVDDCTQQHNNALGIVEMIIRAAAKISEATERVQQNESECRDIDKRATEISDFLSSNKQEAVERGAISGSLENLAKSVDEALTFVEQCKQSHLVRRVPGAADMAKNLRRAKEDTWQKLMVDIKLSIVEKIVSAAAKISQAVQTVHQNTEDCHTIEKFCTQVSATLSKIKETTPEWYQHPATTRHTLEDLAESVEKAVALVTVCQQPNDIVFRLWKAEEMALELRRVPEDIVNKLSHESFPTNIHITLLLNNIRPDVAPPPPPPSRSFPPPSSLGNIVTKVQKSIPLTNMQQADASPPPPPPPPVVDGIKKLSFSERVGSTAIKQFSLSELNIITDNFSATNVIQHGVCTVYKGKLDDGLLVAIKEHDPINYMVRGDTIQDKIDMVSELNHKNIIRPLGYCYVEKEKTFYFVEEYMPAGSMDKFIKGLGADWSSCFQIIQGIAQGVLYLHERHIVHLNLKPSIILLDSGMNPKIGDSLLYTKLDDGDHEIISSTPQFGSIGYIAPEFLQNIVSMKSDMYPFGVILLEISSRMCKSKSTPRDVKDLTGWAWNALGSKGMEKLLHPSLRGNKSQLTEIERCMKVGLLCVQRDRKERPTMVDVLAMLNGEKEVPNPKKPTKLLD